MKKIPKVEFQIGKVNQYVPSMLRIIQNGGHLAKGIFKIYPELNNIMETSDPKKALTDYFTKWEEKNYGKLEDAKKKFETHWNPTNDNLVGSVADIHETNWPKDLESIVAIITPNPICPRDIKNSSFSLYHGFDEETMKKVTLHELSHFAYFKKLKETHPEISEKEYNSPHLAWQVSEMMPAVVLGDKRIQTHFPHKPSYYSLIDKINIEGKPVVQHLNELYSKRKDFADFIEQSYNLSKKHEKTLKDAFSK